MKENQTVNITYRPFKKSHGYTFPIEPVMKLLQVGSMVEVLHPPHLRKTMKGWIKDMYNLYKND